MDVFDKLAFLMRRYDRQAHPATGSTRLMMGDVLQMFDRAGIIELTPFVNGKPAATLRPDPVRKLKVSLLDGISAIHSTSADYYEVFRTAPSGDLSKVKIIAFSPTGGQVGEMHMLVGRRSFEHYFEEDPIFKSLRDHQE